MSNFLLITKALSLHYPNEKFSVETDSSGNTVFTPSHLALTQEMLDVASNQLSKDVHNAPILAALEANDKRAIRAMRDGDEDVILQLRTEAAALRDQLQ